ncbi:MAG: HDOD domain-containing protein [Gammaproteobacteria bacterium]|nr:HDOD domain-containing protein [Gammaproteobacteria bacterium]MBU1442253.1 HDOD domain-containing protein [Gammaproteobacteria bacterium]MBU2410404.1 HDOD domain-containing protein [Gammaproteobacteria bacterium]
MAQSVLGSLTLGYRPLWNRARTLAGLQLFVHEDDQGTDGRHLLSALDETWSAESPKLLLSIESKALLAQVLAAAEASGPLVDVPLNWLEEPELRQTVADARRRGVRMIASGSPEQRIAADVSRWFERRSVALSALDAAAALRAGLQMKQAASTGRVGGRSQESPVQPESLVDGVASRALVEHALDQQGAWAVAGWPVEDVLHTYRDQPMPPTRRGIQQVMSALDEEQSLDRVDLLLSQEPVLAYRLLVYLNSAGLGLRNGVSSLRHGLMLLGFRKLNAWLAEQLPHASEDANLRPVNASMVMRGHLMEHLMESGVEDDLRREVYMCGLFAQLDLVLHEPMRTSLARIPLSDRIVSATVAQAGPYSPALLIAFAMESGDPRPLRALRAEYEVGTEEINRALLRTLASVS